LGRSAARQDNYGMLTRTGFYLMAGVDVIVNP
jgi:hypothetical protein